MIPTTHKTIALALLTIAAIASAGEPVAYTDHLLPDRIVESAGQKQLLLGDVLDKPLAPANERQVLQPIRVAIPTAKGVVVSEPKDADVSAASEPWMLFWYGPNIHSDTRPYGSDLPRRSRVLTGRADKPMLVVMTHKPQSLAMQPGGVELTFSDKSARTFSLPLHGRAIVSPETTAKWNGTLFRAPTLQARRLTDIVLNRPQRIEEQYTFDKGDLVLDYQFRYQAIGTAWADYKPRKLAYLPTSLALAMQWGSLPVRVDQPTIVSPFADTWGPLVFIESDRFSLRLVDMARFVWQKQVVSDIPASKEVQALRAKLASESERMVQAGRLAPVRYWFGEAWIHYYFQIPIETTAPAVQIAKALTGQARKDFVGYIEGYLSDYPPIPVGKRQGPADGKRREWAPGHGRFAKTKEMTQSQTTPLQMAMVLADAAEITGDLDWARKDAAHNGSALKMATRRAAKLDYRTWTIPRNRVQLPEPRDAQNGPNVLTAGLIATARLEHRLGNTEAATLAAAGAVKTLVAHSTYPALLGAWYVGQARDDWRPGPGRINFRYIVARITRSQPYVYHKIWGSCEYQLLTDLTPEIARFWRSLPAKMMAPAAINELYDWAEDWYVTEGEPNFHLAEMSRQPPDCAHAMFRGKAWVAQAHTDKLARWTDVPFCRVGDLWYMEKIALAIQSAGKTSWVDVRQ